MRPFTCSTNPPDMVPAAFSGLITQFKRLVQTNCYGLFAGLPADHWSWVSGKPPGETQQHHSPLLLEGSTANISKAAPDIGCFRFWLQLPSSTKAWWWSEADTKPQGMMGTKPQRPDLCASLEPKLQVVEIPVSLQRQTLIWPRDLLSHIHIHDTF